MTGDYSEKYLRINRDYPAMSGAIQQQLAVQKRLIEKLLKQKQTDDVKELMLTTSISIERTEELLEWMHKLLVGVGEDAQALFQGSKVRTELAFANDLLGQLLAVQHDVTGKG